MTWKTTDATKVDLGVDHSNSVGSFTSGLPPNRSAPGEQVPFACAEPQHTYFLRATGPGGSKEMSIEVKRKDPQALGGTLLVNGAPSTGSLDLTPTKTATLSWQPSSVSPSAVSVVWDLGAGPKPAVSATQPQTLALTKPGQYTVSATASAQNFQSTTSTLTVDVTTTVTMGICDITGTNCPSTAAPWTGQRIGNLLAFIVKWSYPGDGVTMGLYVDWGDNTPPELEPPIAVMSNQGTQNFSHRYSDGGTYTVTFTGKGDYINEDSAHQTVQILRRAVTVSCSTGNAKLACDATVPGDAETPTSWAWDLFNGNSTTPVSYIQGSGANGNTAKSPNVDIRVGFGSPPGATVTARAQVTASYASGDSTKASDTHQVTTCT